MAAMTLVHHCERSPTITANQPNVCDFKVPTDTQAIRRRLNISQYTWQSMMIKKCRAQMKTRGQYYHCISQWVNWSIKLLVYLIHSIVLLWSHNAQDTCFKFSPLSWSILCQHQEKLVCILLQVRQLRQLGRSRHRDEVTRPGLISMEHTTACYIQATTCTFFTEKKPSKMCLIVNSLQPML